MPNASLQSLLTTDLPEQGRMDIWNAFASETAARMTMMPHRPHGYHARFSRIKVGPIGLSWVETDAVTMNVEGGHVGAWSAPSGDAFLLSIQEAGTYVADIGGMQTIFRPGDLVFLDASLPLPWSMFCARPTRTLTIKFPGDVLRDLVKDAGTLCGAKFSADMPKVALGSSILLALKHAIETDPDEDWDENYADVLPDILARTLFGHPRAHVPQTKRSMRQSACDLIARELDDPDLDVGGIADQLGTSIRTIQRAFLEIGVTPRRYILEKRLDAAAEKLKNGDHVISITDVALSSGFNNISYFAREFRKYMGVTAREFRSGRLRPSRPARTR